MNIYLISQDKNNDYDTYDSAVVIAKDADEAKLTHPDGNKERDGLEDDYASWVDVIHVSVKFIGIAENSAEKGVICASFNAG